MMFRNAIIPCDIVNCFLYSMVRENNRRNVANINDVHCKTDGNMVFLKNSDSGEVKDIGTKDYQSVILVKS